MCGILALFKLQDANSAREQAVRLAKKIRHRGPDWSGIYCSGQNIIAHERLAIVDPDSGDQPLYNDEGNIVLGVNGEIYNHIELEELLHERAPGKHKFKTKSDCEVLLHLYAQDGLDFMSKNSVCGMFAFVLLDQANGSFVVVRDTVGIIPLYMGYSKEGAVIVSSELKAMTDLCEQFSEFPPGHMYDSASDKTTMYYTPFWMDPSLQAQSKIHPADLRDAFEKSVVSHMMADVPYGVLLSGGLDSSLVASIMSRHFTQPTGSGAAWPRLHSFSIGLHNSPDLKAARLVADYLKTIHHEYVFTAEQGIDALSDVIYHVETFDVTTIRASTPMYLMARKIRALGVKMVLSGEGADEVFGGYLYFHKAPDAKEFHEENIRKVKQLHLYDCARANKSMMAWGVEARVPFLDRRFLEFAFSFDPKQKMCVDESGQKRVEKWILRKAFDLPGNQAYLPSNVLWRQKEQFSDGVGYTWIDQLQAHANKMITDQQLATADKRFPVKTPRTKEAYLYREFFAKHFGENGAAAETVGWQDSIACSTEVALRWDASFKARADASGRAVAGVHEDAYASDWATKAQSSGVSQTAPNSKL